MIIPMIMTICDLYCYDNDNDDYNNDHDDVDDKLYAIHDITDATLNALNQNTLTVASHLHPP